MTTPTTAHTESEVSSSPTFAEPATRSGLPCHVRTATPRDSIVPGLAGVSETMLWSLYNRASEARRPDGILADPGSMAIETAINYDFSRKFGDPLGSLAVRAAEIDRTLRVWLKSHPGGLVVSLGEGLETQCQRVDNGRMCWLSVDLPDAIQLRERFLTPTPRFRHLAVSALDPIWMDAVDPSAGVFIVAQGLLMYLTPEQVRQLFTSIADRFPGADLVFDTIPHWFSDLTLRGLHQTPRYRLPPMPWGIDRDEVAPTLRRWHAAVATVTMLSYQSPRGVAGLLAEMTRQHPLAHHRVPGLVHVSFADAVGPAHTDITTSREQHMTAMNHDVSAVDAIGGLLAAASQNAEYRSDIAIATRHVIGKRVALGMAATLDPLKADRTEFSRMVPEKVEAFSTAGMVMLRQSGEASRQIIRLASDEVITTARATLEMTGCRNPAALVAAQNRYTHAWFSRATSSWIAWGRRAFEAQAAAMAPIRQTVVANAERLGS